MIAVALQTLFVHLFKQWLFAGEPRPKTFFADQSDLLYFVDGVTVRGFNTFPSGHTASAFTAAFFLILITKNKTLQIVYLIAAFLVGLSRVYILQHFGRDIFFGSIFGIASVVMAWEIMKKCQNKENWQKDYSIVNIPISLEGGWILEGIFAFIHIIQSFNLF